MFLGSSTHLPSAHPLLPGKPSTTASAAGGCSEVGELRVQTEPIGT